MIPPKLPDDEKDRQLAVEKYQLLDTLPEDSYDHIATLISHICETPISLVALMDRDRNFLKSHHGVPMSESPREISFCGHAINADEAITIIEDAREDERFYDNPLVTEHQAIFYAGAPLVNSDGYKLGTLCVFDTRPRSLTIEQKEALLMLSKQVVSLFELRFQNLELIKLSDSLKKRNENLNKFANVVSHDLRSPLSNIISLTELMKDENKEVLSEESLQYLEYIQVSSYSLKDYIDGILKFYKSDDILRNTQERLYVKDLIGELKKITDTKHKITFEVSGDVREMTTNKSALMQILVNLVTNAIKYNSKSNITIGINVSESTAFYNFSVTDNGNGIPNDYLNKIFDLFAVVGVADRNGNVGTGIGLAIVKKIVDNLGGKISVASVVGDGSTFSFSIAKNIPRQPSATDLAMLST